MEQKALTCTVPQSMLYLTNGAGFLHCVQAVRAKRSAASKDMLPDEVFQRIRGALFFGAGFKVTRNKLLFRDNLQELLAAAVPGATHLSSVADYVTCVMTYSLSL